MRALYQFAGIGAMPFLYHVSIIVKMIILFELTLVILFILYYNITKSRLFRYMPGRELILFFAAKEIDDEGVNKETVSLVGILI